MAHLKNIKELLFALALIIGFAACNNSNPTDKRDIQLLSDTSAYHNNASTDSAKRSQANMVPGGSLHHENAAGSHNSANSTNSGTASNGNSTSTNTGTASNSGASSTQGVHHKKGWSKGATDAAIGGAAGAVGGAIISRHHGKGALIGGAIGAAGGYILGHEKDKKDGRVK